MTDKPSNASRQNSAVRGRGTGLQTPNRFEQLYVEDDFEHFGPDEELPDSISTQYLPDASQSIVSENNSPDISFRYSVNPYRGCAHGCAYCYARPSHEYLGMSAGLDFETKIMVKHDAPQLFRRWLSRKGYQPEQVVFSGVTDCYQLAERHFGLTRGCLQVACEARQPIGIITKNAMVTRDLDVLAEMAAHKTISVMISITTLDKQLAHTMEPRTSPPAGRLKAIAALKAAGVPVGVLVAPIIPGLNDSEMPAILEAAAEAGAVTASYTLLRLPLNVEPIFVEWLHRTQPSHAERVMSRIQSTRGGAMSNSQFGQRMRGEGAIAEQIKQTFKVFAKKYGLDRKLPKPNVNDFRRPDAAGEQGWLF